MCKLLWAGGRMWVVGTMQGSSTRTSCQKNQLRARNPGTAGPDFSGLLRRLKGPPSKTFGAIGFFATLFQGFEPHFRNGIATSFSIPLLSSQRLGT
jgi:hypothetical protein